MSTIISSGDRSQLNFREISAYSGLLKYLSLRDVFVRYKQTKMGFAWSIIRPAINILIFGTLSYLVNPTSDFAGRFLTVSAGVVFWQLFSTATTEVSNSLTANANILTKVYFPKIILPLSSLLVSLIDFAIAFVLFLVILTAFTGLPPWQMLFLPIVLFYTLLFAFGLGLAAATASVRFRDVKFILPFLIQILFYASPVFISSDFVLSKNLPSWLAAVYQLNPLVFMLNSFKWCMFGNFEELNSLYAGISFIISLAIVLFALRYFNRFERSFADYI